LNAEDEPEHPDYPKDPEFRKKFGPRGVLHTWADGRSENTGPLTKKRMETVDEEQEPFVTLRLPKLFNLRSDPFETADHEAIDYGRWRAEHVGKKTERNNNHADKTHHTHQNPRASRCEFRAPGPRC
jgi:hypothetical protein